MYESDEERIAIVGIGCRLPGDADNPSAFWDLLKRGADGIVEVPKDRWNIDRFYDGDRNQPGKMYVRAGGFLQQRIDQFDASFFGISPREAAYVDPQQRLLLEVAWEAFEDAGFIPEALAGSDTGVYIGGFMLDNYLTQMSPLNRDHIGAHSEVGSTAGILSNRLSYVFDFCGPSVTMDTACSSSLVAFHHACQALRRGECTLALAGGVNIMYRPENPIAMCKGGFLSPDGRCKSFDARADGYGRGEGAGIVVLKPSSAAIADGNEIYALVRGTGVNQDGHTDGITVPNPKAQEALIRRICVDANVDPCHIRYVEAHGTGTAVGDPLEAAALGAAIGKHRALHDPCVIGSVKANIGHLEAAAGIAGVIKVCLCLQHKSIPPIANLKTPNPNIPFDKLGLRLPQELESISSGEGPILMAVNSFGYGGTNAHAILQDAPPKRCAEHVKEDPSRYHVLPISARSRTALDALAEANLQRLREMNATSLDDSFPLEGEGVNRSRHELTLHNICYSAALHRSHHDHRIALVADSREEMCKRLASFLERGNGDGVAVGDCVAKGQRPVFVFTGMGPQWWGMGRELIENEPEFRRIAETCDGVFQQLAGWSILNEMLADEMSSRMHETHIAQPANFVLQIGLAALWRAWGIEPAAVVGHSVGEVAAAYVTGTLDLADAVRVVYHRSRIQREAAGLGTMLAVGLSEAAAAPLLIEHRESISLAAVNSPSAITLAGDANCLKEIAARLEEKGIFNRFLQVEVAYHSPYMDPLRPALYASLQGLKPRKPAIPLYSTVTGRLAEGTIHDAGYWCRNMREPVYFAKAMDCLIRDGHRVFLEVGPQPVLAASIKSCLSPHGVEGTVLASLRRKQSERRSLFDALAGLYVSGCVIDWRRHYPNGGTYVRLPTYPWQRDTHWQESEEAYFDRVGGAEHALLGRRVNAPRPAWESALNRNFLPYLIDHRVQDLVVLPGAAYIELGLAVHHQQHGETQAALEDLEFHQALVIEKHDEPCLHVTYDEETRRYAVYSRQREGTWNQHAHGRLSTIPLANAASVSLRDIRARCTDQVDPDVHYEEMRQRGLQYGPHFQGVRRVWRQPDGDEVLSLIEPAASLATTDHRNRLHPTLLDAGFQSLLSTASLQHDPSVYVPVRVREVRLYRSPTGHFWCHARLTQHSEGTLEGDLTCCDDDGNVLFEARGVQAKALTRSGRDEIKDLDQWLYQLVWKNARRETLTVDHSGRWLIFVDRDGVGQKLAEQFKTAGSPEVICVYRGDTFQQEGSTVYRIRPDSKADMQRLWEEVAGTPVLDDASVQIAYCWALDADETGLSAVITGTHLIQAVAKQRCKEPARVFFITREAQPVYPLKQELAIGQAPLTGLVRVAMNEYADCRFRIIDMDRNENTLKELTRELLSNSRENEVALRGEARYVHRLVRIRTEELAQRASPQPSLVKGEGAHFGGTYLISGGFGGFGLEVAAWLIDKGVLNLALVGRRGASTREAQQAVDKLRQRGARVLSIAADIADEADVKRLLQNIAETMPPLRGIFHAAAVLNDGPIDNIESCHFENVMKPKALGAWHLHRHTQELPLEHFVMFSSIGSMVGSPGQATYVAANTFLDALAHHRRSLELPAISINWGALGKVGMAARHREIAEYLERAGFGSFTPRQAIKILEHIIGWNSIALGAANMDWQLLGGFYPTWAGLPRNSELFTSQSRDSDSSARHTLLQSLSLLTAEERQTTVAKLLSEIVAEVLRLSPERIDRSQSLLNLGVDSMMAIELQIVIERKLGVKVSTLELMKSKSFTELAHCLLMRLDAAKASLNSSVVASSPAPTSARSPDDLAERLSMLDASEIKAGVERISDEEIDAAIASLLMAKEVRA